MRERPILLNSEMVRAVLEGRKVQTRRVMKVQPDEDGLAKVTNGPWVDTSEHVYNCPFGAVGDRLWVRETWMPDAPRDGTWGDVEFYGCKGSPLSMIPERFRKPEHCIHRASWDGSEMVGWTPSIHMPRWASRITLEITGVRVERLQDISESDCAAEGLGSPFLRDYKKPKFAALWQSIYGDDSWQANPWVWVIEFKRVEDGNA